MKMVTANQASKVLKVSARRVRALIKAGCLPAQKVGRDWVILESDLELVKDRKPGRPKKKKQIMSKAFPTNKEINEMFIKDQMEVQQVMNRLLEGEATAKELNEISKAKSEKMRELYRKMKEDQQARREQSQSEYRRK